MTDLRIIQEADAVPGRRLVVLTVAAVVVVLVSIAVSSRMEDMGVGRAPTKAPAAPAVHRGIVEQTLIERTERGVVLRAEQHAALNRYAFIDGGVARIPIERAMEISADARH